MEKCIKRKYIYKGKLVNLVKDTVKTRGKRTIRELLLHKGSAVIIPLVDVKKKKIILIRQYRYAAGKSLYELPAGTKEKNESTLECAKREVEEETGYKAERIKKVTSFYPAPGVITEKMDLFIATGLRKSKQKLEFDEQITIKTVTLHAAVKMVETGRIIDGKTIIGILLLKELLGAGFRII